MESNLQVAPSRPQSTISNSQSGIPDPSSLPAPDRHRLSLLFRTHGDAVAMAGSLEEDPLTILHWLAQPHIKPFHGAIRAAHAEHRATELHLSLMRALKDITRILDLEADSTLRIRAITAITRLANAIHRSEGWHRRPACDRTPAAPPKPLRTERVPLAGAPATGSATPPSSRAVQAPDRHPRPTTAQRAARELHLAQERVQDAACTLKFHLERRASRADDLSDAKAPLGTTPSWFNKEPYSFPMPFGAEAPDNLTAVILPTSDAPSRSAVPTAAVELADQPRNPVPALPHHSHTSKIKSTSAHAPLHQETPKRAALARSP